MGSIQVPLTGKFHDWIWANAFPPLLLSTRTAYVRSTKAQ